MILFSFLSILYQFLLCIIASKMLLSISLKLSPSFIRQFLPPSQLQNFPLSLPCFALSSVFLVRGSRVEITLINWSISKARSSSVREYLWIYTPPLEGRKGVPQWGPVHKAYLHRRHPHRGLSPRTTDHRNVISCGHVDESNAGRSSNVRISVSGHLARASGLLPKSM